jgi:hypothetical protein
MKQETVDSVKVWLFPTLASIIGFLIWSDVSEIKKDVKQLMAQSNIDKTRIDNLERQIYKPIASSSQNKEQKRVINLASTFAILPTEIKLTEPQN